eukprot:1497571-Rhodomonas_salina.1
MDGVLGQVMRVMASENYPAEAHFCIAESALGNPDVSLARHAACKWLAAVSSVRDRFAMVLSALSMMADLHCKQSCLALTSSAMAFVLTGAFVLDLRVAQSGRR